MTLENCNKVRNLLPKSDDCSKDDSTLSDSTAKAPSIEDFIFIKPISRGAFGKVFLGCKKGRSDQLYAIKVMRKSDMVNKNLVHQVIAERDAMAKSSSPFVVQLFYSMQSKQNIFLVMEYMIGGDVKSLLMICGYFDEDMAVMYIAEVVVALEYLHSKGIIHRDLKPDNMLLTAEGHIKLTDFGLSKINMNFNSEEVSMTPSTPILYGQGSMDSFRTPGQILSLRSSLLFSSKKLDTGYGLSRTPLVKSVHSTGVLRDIHQQNASTPSIKSIKGRPLREQLLSHSMAKSVEKIVRTDDTNPRCSSRIEGSQPVKRLNSEFQRTLNCPSSVDCSSALSESHSESTSSERILSSVASNKQGLSSIQTMSGIFTDADLSDSVFGQSSQACSDSSQQCPQSAQSNNIPADIKADIDNTPQLHKTDEAVWNSYAAKNLRSMRHGSYSEDSEDSDPTNKENDSSFLDSSPEGQSVKNGHSKVKKGRAIFPKSKSFSYPSDDEDSGDRWERRYGHRVRFGRKRSFQDLDTSPARRTHSADSGLTQELRLFNLEPAAKRSNSVPRTRIDFKLNNLTDSEDQCKSESNPSQCDHNQPVNVLKSTDSGSCQANEVGYVLSVTENESDKDEECLCTKPRMDSVQKGRLQRSHRVNEEEEENVLDQEKEQQPVVMGTKFTYEDKTIRNLKRAFVSSVNSVEGRKLSIHSDLSSIYGDDPFCSPINNIVETPPLDQTASLLHAPSTPFRSHKQTAHPASSVKPHLSPLKGSLPPPLPPKNRERRPSGKTTPPKLKFGSMATCIPHAGYSDYSGTSTRSDVPMTPEANVKNRVLFHTPKPCTPHTPYQRSAGRSMSYSVTMKTPYRTPKSVRRGGLPPEEGERILGTPDYLAPEIIQQKKHGVEVDWWALGICMFEFLTGVPPFNDQTYEKVFQNILNRDIPWPEGEEALSAHTYAVIDALLTMDPEQRPKAKEVKKMEAFQDIPWNNLLEMEPPFVPEPDDQTDTSYFDARNNMQDLFVSEVDF